MNRATLIKYGAIALVLFYAVVIKAPWIGERDRTESRAIGTVRAVLSAELEYSRVNGHYQSLECLARQACARADDAAFLDPAVAALNESNGYRFQFHPGPAGQGRDLKSSAITGFAYVAVPVVPDTKRPRSFCGDHTGIIYFTSGGAPRVESGRCVDTTNTVDRR